MTCEHNLTTSFGPSSTVNPNKNVPIYIRDTYLVLDRPRFGLNWSATCRLEVSVQQWGHFVQIGVSNLVDWFAICT